MCRKFLIYTSEQIKRQLPSNYKISEMRYYIERQNYLR